MLNGLHALPNECASFPYIPVCFHRIEVFSLFQNIWYARRILYSLKFAALFDFLNLSFVCFSWYSLTQQFFECRLSWLKPFRFYWLCRRVLSEYEDIRNLHALIISQLRGVLCPEHNQSQININQSISINMDVKKYMRELRLQEAAEHTRRNSENREGNQTQVFKMVF